MPNNLALSFVISANTAAAVQQVQALQRLIQAATGVTPAANPFGAVQSGAAASSQSIGMMVAKYATAAAAITAIAAAFKSGLSINAEIESSVLGIKALVASLTTVKDASGAVVTDLGERIAISGSIAEEEVTKLRIAGLQTAATFQQLLSAFQQGIGAGASGGLSLAETRELTIGITQAAAALGMPMHLLNEEVRSLLSGNITVNTTVAKALGITNEQVKGWRQAGTMAEELNKRLEVFRALGPESGKTWTATLSNVSDAFALLLGEMSKGSFDKLKDSMNQALSEVFSIKNVGIADAFKGLEGAGAMAFDGIGTALNDALVGGVDAARELSAWFVKHEDEVLATSNAFGQVYENVKGVLASIISSIAALAGFGVEAGAVKTAFGIIALVVAMIQDGFQLWKGVIADVGGYILDKVGGPLRTVLGGLRDFLAQIPGIGTGLAAAVDGLVRAIPASGAGLHAVAAGIQADFDAGRTAVARTNLELSRTPAQLKAIAAAQAAVTASMKPAKKGGSSDAKEPPPDADKAKKAADAYATALRAYAAAESEAQKKISQSLKAVAEADLEKSLQARLVSQEGYLRKKAALEQKALAEEIATARQQAALLASDAAAESDPAKKKKLEANLVKVRAEITAFENKGLVINTKLAIDLEAFRREVESLSIDIRANILDMEGNPLGGSLAKLQKETADLRKDPRVRGKPDMEAAVNRQAQLKELRLQFDEQKRLSDNRVAFMSLAEEQIALKVQTGQMTALEGERAVRQARLDAADAILAQVKALEALAAANPGSNEMALSAQRARLEFDKLKTTMDSLATEFNRGAADAVGSAIESWTSGALRFGDALKKVFADVFGNVAKRFLKEFTDNLFKTMEGKDGQGIGGALAGLFDKNGGIGKMFSGLIDSLGSMFSSLMGSLGGAGGSGGGGWGSLISSIGGALGFDEGGFTGHGGKYQAAGIVHKGEYVFTKSEVQRAGLPFFYGLKNQIKGGRRMPGYAEGGFVGGGMAGVAAAMPAPVFSNHNYNQNSMYLDPDDAARHIGRSPVMGREIVKVVFENNASKFSR